MLISTSAPPVRSDQRVLSYALGGGLGHLTRTRAALHTLGLDERNAHIMLPAEHGNDRRVIGDARPIVPTRELERDRDGLRSWVRSVIESVRPTLLLLDAFPAGILGELCDAPFLQGIPTIHLARRLRWRSYSELLRGSPPALTHVYRLEALEVEHDDYLRTHEVTIEGMLLYDPPCHPTTQEERIVAALREGPRPLWIVVHSGSADEVKRLIEMSISSADTGTECDGCNDPDAEHAQPRIVVVAPSVRLQGIECIDLYPATSLFPIADRIVTGGGFNAIRQTALYRERQFAHPFPRRFDDQYWRIRQAMSPQSRLR